MIPIPECARNGRVDQIVLRSCRSLFPSWVVIRTSDDKIGCFPPEMAVYLNFLLSSFCSFHCNTFFFLLGLKLDYIRPIYNYQYGGSPANWTAAVSVAALLFPILGFKDANRKVAREQLSEFKLNNVVILLLF